MDVRSTSEKTIYFLANVYNEPIASACCVYINTKIALKMSDINADLMVWMMKPAVFTKAGQHEALTLVCWAEASTFFSTGVCVHNF